MSIQLINGDCLEEMKSIPSRSVDMVLADPPYGITQNPWDEVISFDDMWKSLKRVVKINGAICLFGAQPFTTKLIASNYNMFKYCWIWKKSRVVNHLNAKKQPMRSVEDVCVFYREQPLYQPQNLKIFNKPINKGIELSTNYGYVKSCNYVQMHTNYPTEIVKILSVSDTIHPTQKPVKLMEYFIKTYTKSGETVLDFAMGVGTTGEACQNLDRKFIGIEKYRKYFELAKTLIRVNAFFNKRDKNDRI